MKFLKIFFMTSVLFSLSNSFAMQREGIPANQPQPPAGIAQINSWFNPLACFAQALNNWLIVTNGQLKAEAGLNKEATEAIVKGTGNIALAVDNAGRACVGVSDIMCKEGIKINDHTMKEIRAMVDVSLATVNNMPNQASILSKILLVNGIGGALALIGILILFRESLNKDHSLETDEPLTWKKTLRNIVCSNYLKGSLALVAGLALVLKSDALISATAL